MGLFDRNPDITTTPFLDSVLSQEVRDELTAGRLPIIQTDSIQLDRGETCHYVERAIYEKKLKLPRGQQQKKGTARAFRSRIADPQRESIVDITFEQIDGFLYITDQRVIFSSLKECWQRSLDDLLAVKTYLNCVKMQFGTQALKVFVPDGNLANTALSVLRFGTIQVQT